MLAFNWVEAGDVSTSAFGGCFFVSCSRILCHIWWVPCHYWMTHPQVVYGGDDLQPWRIAVNKLNKQLQTTNEP
jgi:hypothetical protein